MAKLFIVAIKKIIRKIVEERHPYSETGLNHVWKISKN